MLVIAVLKLFITVKVLVNVPVYDERSLLFLINYFLFIINLNVTSQFCIVVFKRLRCIRHFKVNTWDMMIGHSHGTAQMLYYVNDPGATVSFFRSLLDKDGKLLIMLVSGKQTTCTNTLF